jgi:hypothetical protein
MMAILSGCRPHPELSPAGAGEGGTLAVAVNCVLRRIVGDGTKRIRIKITIKRGDSFLATVG